VSRPTAIELDTLVRHDLSEGGRQFFTPEAIRAWLNEGQDFLVAEELYAVKGGYKFWSVPNQTTYLLREEILAPEALYGRGRSGFPYRIGFENGDDTDARTYMSNNIPTADVVRSVTYRRVAEGLEAEIFPALNSWYPLVYRGSKRMKRLVNDTDETECPNGMTHILVHYALWQAKKKDEEVRQADQWEQQVMRDVMEVRARRMRETASDRNARVRVHRKLGRIFR
jgi:hypothetical protein